MQDHTSAQETCPMVKKVKGTCSNADPAALLTQQGGNSSCAGFDLSPVREADVFKSIPTTEALG